MKLPIRLYCLALAAVLVFGLILAACSREKRELHPPMLTADAHQVTTLHAGGGALPPPEIPFGYESNAYAVSQGQQLFTQFNCSTCHANGGGDIGPPLKDARWIYGSEPAQIHDSIVEGRPNGMPSFHGRIPENQVWQIVAYVRNMGGLAPGGAAPGRTDDMSSGPPPNSNPRQTPEQASGPKPAEHP